MIVCLDSNIFIYALKDSGDFGRHSVELLRRIALGEFLGVASALSVHEATSKPWSISPQAGMFAQMAMEGMERLDYIPLNIEVALRAARLRGDNWTKLNLQDSIHIATALEAHADIFVTNDRELKKLRLDGLKVRLLGEPLRP